MQLELRFKETPPARVALVWATLKEEERVEVVETLARVMAKTVAGQSELDSSSDGEVNDE